MKKHRSNIIDEKTSDNLFSLAEMVESAIDSTSKNELVCTIKEELPTIIDNLIDCIPGFDNIKRGIEITQSNKLSIKKGESLLLSFSDSITTFICLYQFSRVNPKLTRLFFLYHRRILICEPLNLSPLTPRNPHKTCLPYMPHDVENRKIL